MNPLVSVIIPCYNQGLYLSETLESVISQTYINWECIIVNDGSSDNTEEIARQYCNKDNRFKYVCKENGGLSSARNFGIRNSNGEFILPLDSDDLIGPEYFQKALEHFQLHPETKLVYCRAELFGDETGEWKLLKYDFVSLLYDNIIFCSAFYRKSDYFLTCGYDENLKSGLEDWDFWLSLLDANSIVFQLPEIHFYYRIRPKSMIRSMEQQTIIPIKKNICNAHHEKYINFIPALIWENNRFGELNEIISKLEVENDRIRSSKAYRLGKFILRPFTYFKNRYR